MKKLFYVAASLLLLTGMSLTSCTKEEEEDTNDTTKPLTVSHDPTYRMAVVEEYTGCNCGYCPQGHKIVDNLLSTNSKVLGINVHTGSLAPKYSTEFGSALYAQTGGTGVPSGTVNRHAFSSSNTTLNPGYFSSYVSQITSQRSCVNLAARATIDRNSRVLTVDVAGYYTGNSASSTNKLNVALVQNNVIGTQRNFGSPLYYAENYIDSTNLDTYRHQHMLRHMLTGQWGETISPTTQGSSFNKTYTYTLPTIIGDLAPVPENMEVIVFMAEGQQEIITGVKANMTLK
jgi:hypothetical protein